VHDLGRGKRSRQEELGALLVTPQGSEEDKVVDALDDEAQRLARRWRAGRHTCEVETPGEGPDLRRPETTPEHAAGGDQVNALAANGDV
jgi:hypothetical protein